MGKKTKNEVMKRPTGAVKKEDVKRTGAAKKEDVKKTVKYQCPPAKLGSVYGRVAFRYHY